MTSRSSVPRLLFGCAMVIGTVLTTPRPAQAQDDGPRTRHILSIGHYPRVDGIRLNFRDRELDLVRGANVTVWMPYDGELTGTVRGLALGLPGTGAGRISGLGAGILGVAAADEMFGLMFGGLGVGTGGRIRGLAIGGLGVGAGDDVRGIVGGVLGVGSGGDLTGIGIGGLGIGAAGQATGLLIGGLGAGVGGGIDGVALAVLGVGSGGMIRGVAVAGLGVGAPRIEGIVVATAAGAEYVKGFVFAPAHFLISPGGELVGASVSAYNRVQGHVQGFTIGILNYAWSVDGVQVGAINVIRDNPRGRRVLPVINW